MQKECRIASNRRGVYFIANDGVIDNTIAFLNSFRAFNPRIALCLVPYDDSIDRISALESIYDFTIWRDAEHFSQCDRISMQFHGTVYGHYRKIALWEGPFDEFIYIDTDTVVLQNVNFVFDYLQRYAFVTSHSNIPSIRKWVWKDTINEVTELTREQISFAANTGFIASRASNLSVARAFDVLPHALSLVRHMELLCREQPFLNYLFVTSGFRFTSLRALYERLLSDDISIERWGGNKLDISVNGRIVDQHYPRTLLVHWAGEWMRSATEGTQIQNRALWEYFRFLHVSSGE